MTYFDDWNDSFIELIRRILSTFINLNAAYRVNIVPPNLQINDYLVQPSLASHSDFTKSMIWDDMLIMCWSVFCGYVSVPIHTVIDVFKNFHDFQLYV